MSSSIYDKLLELPLFRGATRERMSEIVGSCRFDFVKYSAGETIISKGDACKDLGFVLSGSVRATLTQDGNPYALHQTFKENAVIAPEYMFGRLTVYPLAIAAIDDVSMLRIPKNDFTKILNSDSVFLFNFVNMVCMLAQKNFDGIVSVTSGNPVQALAYWAYIATFSSSYDIVYECPPEMLSHTMGVSEEETMRILNDLKTDGIIDYNLSEVKIIDRNRLLKFMRI